MIISKFCSAGSSYNDVGGTKKFQEGIYHGWCYDQFNSKIQHMLHYPKDAATKHSIIRTESCSYLTWLVVFIKTTYISTWSACCQHIKQCSQSYFAYTNHAANHKKLKLINIAVCLKIPQRNLNWDIKRWGNYGESWTWFSRFVSPL